MDQNTELSMRRTGMSFQRTRLSGDRTMMSVIRTSLSLISFGFTIYQVLDKLLQAGTVRHSAAPRNFGLTLVLLGMLLLVGGLIQEVRFAAELRRTRDGMAEAGLIYGQSRFPFSPSVVTAVALLVTGFVAAVGIAFNVSFFS
jgi:putative membrane protein